MKVLADDKKAGEHNTVTLNNRATGKQRKAGLTDGKKSETARADYHWENGTEENEWTEPPGLSHDELLWTVTLNSEVD